MRKRAHGEVVWSINQSAVYGKYNLSKDAERRLTKFFEIPEDIYPIKKPKQIDRKSLAFRYKVTIDQGYVKNQADLAVIPAGSCAGVYVAKSRLLLLITYLFKFARNKHTGTGVNY